MKFDAREAKIFVLPNGGAAVCDIEGRIVAYKKIRNSDLKNWDFVCSDFRDRCIIEHDKHANTSRYLGT